MRRLLLAVFLAIAVYAVANAQIVTPGGGGGPASSLQFTNTSLPITSASAGSQCLQTNAGGSQVILGSCAGGGAYPAGNLPQIGGFSALNTSEAETVGGDFTFTRAGANSYTATVTKTSGTPFGTAATQSTGTSGATIPLLNAANTWSGVQTITNSDWKLLGSSTGGTTFTSANASATNFTLTVPAATDTIAELGQSQTFTGTDTFSTAPVMSGASITSNTIADASLATQGGVTAGSYTNSNLTVNAQGIITAVSNGAGGGGTNPIFTQTITESAGAATMVVNSSSTAHLDTDYVALNANATITTPASSAMADGQEIFLIASTSGTPFTITYAAGAGTTLGTIVLGDGSPFGTAAACGTVPSTGYAWFKWKYQTSVTKLTLEACGINPPPATVGAALGGTGIASPTAHSLLLAEGSSAFALITAATAGNIIVDQGAGADYQSKAVSGDTTLASSGSMNVLGLHFGAANAVTLPTTAPTSGGIPYFSSSGAISSSAALTANAPVIGGGAGVAPSVGTRSGNTTQFGTATGTLTSGDYASWDASGNLTTTADVNALPVDKEHSSTISAATLYSMLSSQVSSEVFTFSATATVTLPVAAQAGQTINGIVCQNGTGGFTPTFNVCTGSGTPIGGCTGAVTFTGTWPTFTTTANKCGDFSVHYTTTTTAYLVGSTAGPL